MRWSLQRLASCGPLLGAGCLSVSSVAHDQDLTIRTFEAAGPHTLANAQLHIEPTATDLTFRLENVFTCTEEHRASVKRWHVTKRSGSTALHALEYIGGGVIAAMGGLIVYDNRSSTGPADRAIPIGTSVDQGRAAGIGIAGVGGLLLLVGVIDSVRTRDSRDFVGTLDVPVPGPRSTASCELSPASGSEIGLVFTSGDAHTQVYVSLGRTDRQGRLTAAWSSISGFIPAAAKPTADIVMGADHVVLDTLEIPSEHRVDSEAAWRLAVATDTAAAYRAYLAANPASPHVEQAGTRKRVAVTRDAAAEIGSAVAAGDVARAETALTLLRLEGDPASLAEAQASVDALRSKQLALELRRRFGAGLAAIDATPGRASVAAAAQIADEIERLDAMEGSRSRQALTETRDRVVVRLVKEARELLAKDDLSAGVAKFDVALELAVDPKAVRQVRDPAIKAAIAERLAGARRLARDQSYDQAIDVVDVVTAIAPGNATLVSERRRWVSARDQRARSDDGARQRAAAAKLAREARTEAARVEQERIVGERAVAAATRAEREREAAAKLALEDAERRAKEQAAKDDAARRARETKDRVLDQAERRVQEEQDALERKRAAIEAQRASNSLAARTGDARALQFELSTAYATEPVLDRIPIPSGCTSVAMAFRRMPSDCGASCTPRAMTKLDMRCAGGTVSLVRDRRYVLVSCDAKQSCTSCLLVAQTTLATFSRGGQPTVVRSCPKVP